MEQQTNYFVELAGINVNEHVEKKNGLNYLSWAWAVDQLKRYDPQATWEVIRHNGLPYIKTEIGYFVEVAVTCKGVTHSDILPVLDNRNKPLGAMIEVKKNGNTVLEKNREPNAFDINNSHKRCLTKVIGMHGLGLYLYGGEDLPWEEKVEQSKLSAEQLSEIETRISTLLNFGGTREQVFGQLEKSVGYNGPLASVTPDFYNNIIGKLNAWIKAKEKAAQEQKLMEDYGAEIVDESKGA